MTPADDETFRELGREMFAAHESPPDLEAIDRLFAMDFVSTNADGRVVDKQEWLNILRTGQFAVEKITTADFKVRRFAGTAVVTGRSTYFKDGKRTWDVRHTQVWAEFYGSRWQLVSWQGTSISST